MRVIVIMMLLFLAPFGATGEKMVA